MSFPSAKDPDFARRHPGKSTVEVITLVPYEWFAKWEGSRWQHRNEEYEALKAKLTGRLMEVLEKHVPAVRGRVEHAELSTPLTTRHFANYAQGEIYGVSARPERYELRELGARTPVKGLYLTGQDVVSLGVAGALFGGVISASVALGRNLMGKMGEK
jgi:all-trans-retinol 13,14-reductase